VERKPIIFIFFIGLIFTGLNFFFEDKTTVFDNLSLLFGLCFIVAMPKKMDNFLSNYTKKSAWAIILILAAITIWLVNIDKTEGFWGDIVSFFLAMAFFSFVLYLLLPPIKGIFYLIKKIKWKFVQRFVNYINKLLTPNYLFPIKLISYSAYYLIKFLIKAVVELVKIIIDLVKFPFKSFRNFLKSLFIVGLVIYVAASTFVMIDYINKNYGYYGKFICSPGTSEKLKKSVVRIVGGYSEGTGFFISNNQVLTNFHVIADEPSPKIIFPDGSFITPIKITGNKNVDLAILFTEKDYPNMVTPLPNSINLKDEEPVIATGFPMGTDLVGKATVLRGNFIDFRKSKSESIGYLQTNISLVSGMSGGPLTDQCGSVVGINTMGLAGLSLFISGSEAKELVTQFSDQEIKKINVDPSKSPEEAVRAFYTYLSSRRMKDGFDLLSQEYLQKTNFEEWTSRFTDILDVYVYKAEKVEKTKDMVLVKFYTKNWVDQETEFHYYEGTWQTVFEDGKYKMLKSNIKEIMDPTYTWFYE